MSDIAPSTADPSPTLTPNSWLANLVLSVEAIAFVILTRIEWRGRQEGHVAIAVVLITLLVSHGWAFSLCMRAFRKERFWPAYGSLMCSLLILNAWIFSVYIGPENEMLGIAKMALYAFYISLLVPLLSLVIAGWLPCAHKLCGNPRFTLWKVLIYTLLFMFFFLLLIPVPFFAYNAYYLDPFRQQRNYAVAMWPYSRAPKALFNERVGYVLIRNTPEFLAELAAIATQFNDSMYETVLRTGRVSEARLRRESEGKHADMALQGMVSKNPRAAADIAKPLIFNRRRVTDAVCCALSEGLSFDELMELISNAKITQINKYSVLNSFQNTASPGLRRELSERVLSTYGKKHTVVYISNYFDHKREPEQIREIWSRLITEPDKFNAIWIMSFLEATPPEFKSIIIEQIFNTGSTQIKWAFAFRLRQSQNLDLQQRKTVVERIHALLLAYTDPAGAVPPQPWSKDEFVEFARCATALTASDNSKILHEQLFVDWDNGLISDAHFQNLLRDFCLELREKLKE